MNDNFTKLVAMIIVGSVAKSLFGQPVVRPQTVTQVFESAKDVVEAAKS